MTAVILTTACAVLLVLFLCYYFKYRTQSRHLQELKNAIAEARRDGLREIHLFCSEPALHRLIPEIDSLLEAQSRIGLEKQKQEERERRMLVNISHDLRTPLTVIYGYTEMLLTNGYDKRKLEKIYSKTRDVLNMVNLFFDLTKMESGELPLKEDPVDVCEVCRVELAGYYEILQDSDFQVEIKIPETELFIKGDEQALKRILGNLIQNAVRYGADGRFLGVRIWPEENNVRIDVTDHGKGILEENQDKIFERLTTLEDSRNKKYQGSGLGLTITKRLAEAMNGSIELKSSPNTSTTFSVCFPKL